MWQILTFVLLAVCALLVVVLLLVAGTAATHQQTWKSLHEMLLSRLFSRDEDSRPHFPVEEDEERSWDA